MAVLGHKLIEQDRYGKLWSNADNEMYLDIEAGIDFSLYTGWLQVANAVRQAGTEIDLNEVIGIINGIKNITNE